ncbi:WD repeat and HMG-box DNA-binding 1 isoform X1 [Brachionus plicatilis]|uniref:WD repeat and HMG-box DNA-binding 1 isoform X1 n=1 Tax=Brachionus plicatilis TaxID=10195 RepID=A0A3M7PNR0_BRAPC|nr:WD repeat and HMG-box DNA-binding 1 isoform X1 [Brachionus plicatilis]
MHNTRYAHSEGYTDICFAENGKFLTTGEDGEVRIWNGFDDLDNTSIQVGDKCFAIAYNSGKIYVSDELNELKRYDLETSELLGVVTSFTLPITSIAINKSNSHLVCGSSDFDIHLVDLNTLKFTSFSGHEAPILSVVFDPLEKYFASSSCDGSVKFWSISNLTNCKTLANLHPKSNDFADSPTWAKLAWHKDAGLIAIPSHKDVHFYERETWILKFKINLKNESSPAEDFSAGIVCFSPDGKYVLASTNTQMIYIHSIINKSLMFKYSYSKKSTICSLIWLQDEVIFCDKIGSMGQIKPRISDDISVEAAKTKKSHKENLEMDDLLDLLDSDERSNGSEVDMGKKRDLTKEPVKKRKRLNDDDDDDDGGDINSGLMDKAVASRRIVEEDDDDIQLTLGADDDDDDGESLEKLKQKTYDSVKKEIMTYDENMSDNEAVIEEVELSEKKKEELFKEFSNIQAPFQPSSTPLALLERFMCWNSVGVVSQFCTEGDESIDIEFHNASHHHTIHIKNQFGYTMADVSKEAVVLASPGTSIEQEVEVNSALSSSIGNQSKLTVILINSLDNSKEWNMDMVKKEYIKCVCVSRSLVACCTNKKFLRIFGLAGTQKEIVSLAGIPICVAAYDHKIFVAYNISNNSTGYSIYGTDGALDAEHGILPLSENSKIEWLGFSDEGNPYVYDSNGYLHSKCWTISKTTVWTPLSNLRATLNHKSDNYWIVGIAERNQMIKAVLCRASRYPHVLPRPTLSTLQFTPPLIEPESEKSLLEIGFWKNKQLGAAVKNYDCSSANLDMDQDDLDDNVDKFESSAREALMKLFMLACKNSKEQKAYEIATIMDLDAVQLAIKYATKSRALVLAQNLNILAEKKAEIEYQKERRLAEESEPRNYTKYLTERNENQENSLRSQIEDTSAIIVEKVTQAKPAVLNTSVKITDSDSQDIEIEDSCMRTPTISHTPRLNPFAKSGASARFNAGSNDSPKSILNEIEEKLNKSSSGKEKDTWRPTPTRKLTKSKLSGTPGIGSFFNK